MTDFMEVARLSRDRFMSDEKDFDFRLGQLCAQVAIAERMAGINVQLKRIADYLQPVSARAKDSPFDSAQDYSLYKMDEALGEVSDV